MCLKKFNISFRLFSLSLIIIKTGMFLVMFIFDIICLNHLTYVNVYVCFKLCNEKVPFTMRTIFSDPKIPPCQQYSRNVQRCLNKG